MFTTILVMPRAIGPGRLRGRSGSRVFTAGWPLGVAASLGLGLLGCSDSPRQKLMEYEEVAGQRLGEWVMNSVAGDGPILILRSPSDLDSDEPTAGRCRGLRRACPGRSFIEAGPDPLDWGPPSEDFHILTGEDWADQILAWCGQHPDAVAVVSLLFEFPPLPNTGAQDLPPFYGFTAGPSPNWAKAMQAGRLKAVVRYTSGNGAPNLPPRGASAEEIFDLRFELITPENFQADEASGR